MRKSIRVLKISECAFTTGYLTQVGRTEEGALPPGYSKPGSAGGFRLQINEWFKKSIFSNTERLNAFWKAVEAGIQKESSSI